jgi:hypothetical protein
VAIEFNFTKLIPARWRPKPVTPPAGGANGASPPKDGNEVKGGVPVLAALKGGTDLAKISAEGFEDAGRYIAKLPADKREKLAADLKKAGVNLVYQPEVKEVGFMTEHGAANVDLASNEVRVTVDNAVTVYQGAKAIETMAMKGGKWEVTRDGKTQSWDPDTGVGSVDGKPIPPRFADPVKGEAARKPWPTTPANKLAEPPEDPGQDFKDYAKIYNKAVEASGGKVVEAIRTDYNEATYYNCHSFATTGAHGDLHDPFANAYQPRWVNFPTYQLTNGPFKQLKPEQRVHVGDVILYQKDGVPTHTGKVIAVDADGNPSRVESKWGSFGLYEHGPFDVPAVYGEIGAFYRPDGK